jgi:predicted nucleic acid-binding protein
MRVERVVLDTNVLISAVLSPESSGMVRVRRNPDDDKLLEIAVAGRADCLVTGDQGLLVLDPFQRIPILTPAGFLAAVSPRTDPTN